MRGLVLTLIAASFAVPAAAQRVPVPIASTGELESQLDKGMTLETRLDGDLNGDGETDTAFVGSSDDARKLYVLMAYRSEVDLGHDPIASGPLDTYPVQGGPAALEIRNGVLIVRDLTGGTSATSAIYRYRYDAAKKKMRLIGLDAKFYSRTNQHGWNGVSWNLLTGDYIEESADLRGEGENANYGPTKSVKSKKPVRIVWMEDTPSAEGLVMPGE